MSEDELDLLFHAMASQPRRAILDLVRSNPGCNLAFVTGHFDFSRIGVMKHLDVLTAANLLVSQKTGRERSLFFNPVPLQEVHEDWTDQYSRHFAGRLTSLKRAVEKKEKSHV
ncbi:MAG: helix-turn-helix transcriptional regulator [Usitatibacteraceae bacterium]